MTLNWKEVWNRRSVKGDGVELDDLIRLDGFDVGAGRIQVMDWLVNAVCIADKLGVQDGDAVYEVGCGSGAFLYALRERHFLSVGGIDFADGLIAAATRAMPDGNFKVGEASVLEVIPQYDWVVSNGVFHYFDFDYAGEVLDRMINKAKRAVAVMEVPDSRTQTESEALRRTALGSGEYDEKYAGLGHTYYPRDWFKKHAESRGLPCEIFGSCVPHSAQSRFRFGCIIRMK